jgi:hypothetical protein
MHIRELNEGFARRMLFKGYTMTFCTATGKFNEATFQDLVGDDSLRSKLMRRLREREKVAFNRADEQLRVILKDERGGVLQAVNHYFADTLSAIRKERALA